MSRWFDDYMTSLTAELHEAFGFQDVTYTPETGSAITLDVFFFIENAEQNAGYDATIPKRLKRVQAVITDMQSLDYHGYFTIAGNSYDIADIEEDDGHQITFLVKDRVS